MSALLSWGRDTKTGRLVHISEAENGLSCNLVCPDTICEGALIARQGESNEWHYAHVGICKAEEVYAGPQQEAEKRPLFNTSGREIAQWTGEQVVALLIFLAAAAWLVYRVFFREQKAKVVPVYGRRR